MKEDPKTVCANAWLGRTGFYAHLRVPSCISIKDIQSVQHVQVVHSPLTIQQESPAHAINL